MEYINIIGSVASVFGALLAWLAWSKASQIDEFNKQEQERQNQTIDIVLQHGDQKYKLPGSIRRADFSRIEILGRIGMIPMKEKGKRFEIKYTNQAEFYQQINQIAEGGANNILTIPCTVEEYEQFDI